MCCGGALANLAAPRCTMATSKSGVVPAARGVSAPGSVQHPQCVEQDLSGVGPRQCPMPLESPLKQRVPPARSQREGRKAAGRRASAGDRDDFGSPGLVRSLRLPAKQAMHQHRQRTDWRDESRPWKHPPRCVDRVPHRARGSGCDKVIIEDLAVFGATKDAVPLTRYFKPPGSPPEPGHCGAANARVAPSRCIGTLARAPVGGTALPVSM